jgi:hypothetical protein
MTTPKNLDPSNESRVTDLDQGRTMVMERPEWRRGILNGKVMAVIRMKVSKAQGYG